MHTIQSVFFQPWQKLWTQECTYTVVIETIPKDQTISTQLRSTLKKKLQDRVGLSVYPPFLVSGRVRPIERIWFLAVGHRTNKLCEPRKKNLPRENYDACAIVHCTPQSTYFTVRGQSYFSRLPKQWPPPCIPLSARRVCPPPATKAHSPGGEGDGGSIHILEDEINRIALLQ